MQFGLDKCAKASFKKGKLTKTTNVKLDDTCVIQELAQEGTYKYLGIDEGNGIKHAATKEKVRKEYYRRIKMILKSELNSCNKITAINALAIPVVSYSLNVINWQMKEIRKMDAKTRKLMTMYRMNHPKADVDRIYLPRKEGGRGLMQLEYTYKISVIGLDMYLEKTKDRLLRQVYKHDTKKKLYSIHKDASKFRQDIQLQVNVNGNQETTPIAKRVTLLKKDVKLQILTNLKERWKGKPLHGQYPEKVDKADVDKELTHRWLQSSELKSETEGLIIAAQDQSLATRYYQHRIIKNGIDPKCRLCHEFDESVEHIVSGCPVLAKKEYLERHDKALIYVHWNICNYYQIDVPNKWYDHKPEKVVEGKDATILWDMPIITDKEIKANRPDIVIKEKPTNMCMLIDMAVPSDRNIAAKEVEKISKYNDLEIEVSRMWKTKTTVTPLVIGALGIIRKGVNRYIERIPGNIKVEELQKIVLLGTAHILRRTLSIT